MRFLIISGLLIIGFSNSSFKKNKDWSTYTSNAFGYTIEFPEQPVLSVENVSSEIGNLKMNLCTVKKKRGSNLVYLSNCTEYPEKLVNSDKKEDAIKFLFRNAIDATTNNLKATLLSEKEIKMGDYPGREITMNYQNGKAIIKMRLYLVRYYIYTLEVITKEKKAGNADIDRFLNSFKLINL
jgi:hypothetical protein